MLRAEDNKFLTESGARREMSGDYNTFNANDTVIIFLHGFADRQTTRLAGRYGEAAQAKVVRRPRQEAGNGRGLVDFRHGEPCPVCGEECKRSVVDGMRDGREVAYVGDGYSDRCASKAADIRFARRALAQHLDREGVDYIGFDDFTTVRDELLGPGAA